MAFALFTCHRFWERKTSFPLNNSTVTWDNPQETGRMEMMKAPHPISAERSWLLLPQAPQLSFPASIKQMFIPSRGMKPFRLELPLQDENPISQNLLKPHCTPLFTAWLCSTPKGAKSIPADK